MSPTHARTLRLRLLRLCCWLVLIALAACDTNTIVISGTYPSPLAHKLPLTLGVYYPPELRNYSYKEPDDTDSKDQYIVQSGAAQLRLFNTMLPALFTKVVLLDAPDQALGNGNIDAVFTPTLADFQLTLPQKTQLKVYEIWMKYTMQLSKANGEPIASWVVTAYGKAPFDDTQTIDSGVKGAAMVAMRDLEASFSLGFAEVPEIKHWLQANNRDK